MSETKLPSVIFLLSQFWGNITNRRRLQFLVLVILMVIASFAEILSIGSILPFLSVLINPEKLFNYSQAQFLIHLIHAKSPSDLLLPMTMLFGCAAFFAGFIRLLLLWASTRFSYGVGSELSVEIYQRTLYQSYITHVNRNSSEVIDAITNKTERVTYLIMMVLNLLSSSIILMTVLITLLVISPIIALSVFASLAFIYACIINITRTRLLRNSTLIANESTRVLKCLQEGLGGIRDVLIDNTQSAYCEVYKNADYPLRRAIGDNHFIGHSPRYVVEALGMILIAAISFLLTQKTGGITSAIPILGALALGAQRLLPILQNAFGAWAGIRGTTATFQEVLLFLRQPFPDNFKSKTFTKLDFKKQLRFKQVCFRYSSDTPWVLQNFDLTIFKGERIGLVGITGSGKSTVLDIVMGLLEPETGFLEVDGKAILSHEDYRSWQTQIAHVPQSIFLADTSFAENIALGVPKEKIDYERVKEAAIQAKIASMIEGLPRKYESLVGERGVRLSGGQRQRIGIARALYKKADVIILDEATSALDNKTEQDIIEAVENLSKDITIIMVAHRLSTLKNCSKIIEIVGGRVSRINSYSEIESNY
jgi:ATP-binding cassette subfamily B protein